MPQGIYEFSASPEYLTRKARRIRIEANRASGPLAGQLIALAERYEDEARRRQAAASSDDTP